MRVYPLVLVLFLTVSPALYGQTFSTPIKISGSTAAHSPCLQTAGDSDVYVAWFANAADIWFARSSNGGAAFTSPIRVSEQVTSNIYTSLLQRTPRFIVDTKGVIHMVWTEERVNGQNDVWYVRSTDHGDTWTAPRSIMDPDDSAKYPQDFSNIACDSSGNLYVSYLDFRGVVRGVQDYAEMHLTKSTDAGEHWSRPVVANNFRNGVGGTCECCKQDIAVSPDGKVYIAFRSNINNKRDIWLARSVDGSLTFDSSIRVQTATWTINACPTTGPSIALDRSGNLHFGWCDTRDDSGRSIGYYSLLPESANTIFPNRSTSRAGLQSTNWPSIAVSRIHGGIGYIYQAGTSSKGRFAYSADGGNSWTQDVPIPNPSGAAQSLATLAFGRQGDLYASWQEGGNAGSIYVAKVNVVSLPAPQGPEAAHPTPEQNPSIESTRLTILWQRPAKGIFQWYTYTVRNLYGDSVVSGSTRDTFVTLEPIKAGTYIFSLTTRSSVGESIESIKLTRSSLGVHREDSDEPIVSYGDREIRIEWPGSHNLKGRVVDILGRTIRLLTGDNFLEFPNRSLARGRYTVVLQSDAITRTLPLVLN